MIDKKFFLKVSMVSMIFLLILLISSGVSARDANTLVLSCQNEPGSLDPHQANAVMEYKTLGLMYDTLLFAHPETMEPVPGLAKSWEISDDGLVATFHLREGVKFHDGTLLTAEDFKYTFERAKDPATQAAGLVRQVVENLERVEVVDELTFKLIYNKPLVTLLHYLQMPYSAPINRKSVEAQGEDFGSNPVGAGTGPYKFESWQAAQAINFVRNEDYNWGPEFYENQGPPHIEKIELLIIQDLEVQTLAVLNEEIDIVDFLPAKDVAAIDAHPNIGLAGLWLDGISIYSSLNVSKPPFDDVAARKAAAYAIDKQAIIDVVKLGQSSPVESIIPPFWFGYNDKVEGVYYYDPDKARGILDEAGWEVGSDGIRQKDGVRLSGVFLVRQREDYINCAQMIQQMFKDVGIELNIQILEWGTLIEGAFAGVHNYFLMGYSRSTPEHVLNLYFHSNNIDGWNMVKVADPELDRKIETAVTTVDREKRRELIEELQEIIIIEQCYWIPIYNDFEYDSVHNRVQGMIWAPKAWLYPNDARIVE